jgi:aminopeptidase N
MDASQAFPCFDQPDLKARFDLDLTAPDTWDRALQHSPGIRSARQVRLPPHVFRRDAALAYLPVRLRRRTLSRHPRRRFPLFVRQSKFERATQEAPEVLRIARAGVRHMAEYFDSTSPSASTTSS